MSNGADIAADKRREAQLRRMAATIGLALRKSRTRDPDRMDFGCYRIEDKEGHIIAGSFPYPYSLTLDAVEEALYQIMANPAPDKKDLKVLQGHGCVAGVDPLFTNVPHEPFCSTPEGLEPSDEEQGGHE